MIIDKFLFILRIALEGGINDAALGRIVRELISEVTK